MRKVGGDYSEGDLSERLLGSSAPEAVAKAGVEAGALFDKNSALPLTLYTLKLA